MDGRTLEVHLNVDDVVRSHGDSAYLWLSTVADRLTPEQMAELASLPAETSLDPYGDGPQGEPGTLYGFAEVTRLVDRAYETRQRRNLSTEGWAWLRTELEQFPSKVTIQVGRLTDGGFLGGDVLRAGARTLLRSPGWLVLEAPMAAERFTDRSAGSGEQRRWLRILRELANILNPGFGHVDYWRDKGRTALEYYSGGPGVPIDQRSPQFSIAYNRQRLRGYSWLTITSREVAVKLGGAEALAATGAFTEVEPLAGGGLWLLATDDFNDWGMPAAEAVFHAVASALPPGAPVARHRQDPPPTFLVFADPSADGRPAPQDAPPATSAPLPVVAADGRTVDTPAMGEAGRDAAVDPGGEGTAGEPGSRAKSPTIASAAPGGAPWYSVAGGGPKIPGAVRVTTGPRAVPNGFDDDVRFHRVWAYTGTVLSVTVDINRADPHGDEREWLRWGARIARSAGHTVVPLTGIADGGIAILSHEQIGNDRPFVRAEACSGNARVSVLMQMDGVLENETELTARSTDFITVLSQALDGLRPR